MDAQSPTLGRLCLRLTRASELAWQHRVRCAVAFKRDDLNNDNFLSASNTVSTLHDQRLPCWRPRKAQVWLWLSAHPGRASVNADLHCVQLITHSPAHWDRQLTDWIIRFAAQLASLPRRWVFTSRNERQSSGNDTLAALCLRCVSAPLQLLTAASALPWFRTTGTQGKALAQRHPFLFPHPTSATPLQWFIAHTSCPSERVKPLLRPQIASIASASTTTVLETVPAASRPVRS